MVTPRKGLYLHWLDRYCKEFLANMISAVAGEKKNTNGRNKEWKMRTNSSEGLRVKGKRWTGDVRQSSRTCVCVHVTVTATPRSACKAHTGKPMCVICVWALMSVLGFQHWLGLAVGLRLFSCEFFLLIHWLTACGLDRIHQPRKYYSAHSPGTALSLFTSLT